MKFIATLSLVIACATATPGYAQQGQPRTAREDALDPSPVDPSADPNIDMTLIGIAPRTMPQPHSHPAEECWIMRRIRPSGADLSIVVRQIARGFAFELPWEAEKSKSGVRQRHFAEFNGIRLWRRVNQDLIPIDLQIRSDPDA